MTRAEESSGRVCPQIRRAQQSDRRARKMRDRGSPTFRFMDLPVELRVMVYIYLLGTRYPGIVVHHRRSFYLKSYRLRRSFGAIAYSGSRRGREIRETLNNIGLLKTCKLVRDECAPILYSSQFVFRNCDALNLFNNMVGDMQRYIKHIRLTLPNWSIDMPLRKLDLNGLTNLRTLQIRRGEL